MTSPAAALSLLSRRIPRIAAAVPGGKFGRRVLTLAGSTAVAQVISIAIAPLLTRIYSVDAFGHLQVYVSLMGFATIVMAMRYEFAVILPEDERVAINLVATAFLALLGTTASLAALVYCTLHFHLFWQTIGGVGACLWFLPFGALGAGVYQVLVYWGLRHQAYKEIAVSKLSQVLTQSFVQLTGGILSHGSFLTLIAGDACGRAGGSLRIAAATLRHDKHLLDRVRFAEMWRAAKRYRNFPLVLTGASLINSAGLQAVALVLSAYYGAAVVGLYAVVDRTLQIPGALVAQAMSQVYAAESARLGAKDPQALRRLFGCIVSRSLLVGLLPAALIALIAPDVFAIAFGKPWRMAGNYARILMPLYYFSFTHNSVCMTLNMLERQTWQATWDITRLCGVLGVLIGGARAGFSRSQELMAFCAVGSLAYVIHLLLCYLAIGRRARAAVMREQPIPVN